MITFKEFISESIEDKGILKAIFIVGIPGAGKSYTASRLSGSISPRIVNTDRATEYLTKKTGVQVNVKNWPTFKDDAHRITRGSLANYLNSLLPLFIDGTSNDASNILHRAGILESLGYDVGMIFIDTSLETALKRAASREREVDPEFIKAVNSEAQDNKSFFQSKFSFFKTIKNDDGELTDDALVEAFKKVEGFYSSPLMNPVGKRFIADLKEKNAKYLTPDVMSKEVLSKKIAGWYK